MDPPASLPSFKQLADRIAKWTTHPKKKGEDPVTYLSRMHDCQIDVHQKASEILTEKDPKPNPLHLNLLQLYARQQQPRIVTTNFDLLFETVQRQGPVTTCSYSAPTLPPGHRFQGIVHLHGTTDHPEDMVLTDGNVSVAYLHEGWALTFLKQLFSKFTVLFIGYSHEDTIVQYLARGMPAQGDEEQQRFALEIENREREQLWRNRGVTPITFPPKEQDKYGNLAEGIEKLAEYMTRQPSQWQQHIVRIAERPNPPTDPEEEDTIKEALRDSEEKLRFFTEAAKGPKWLEWLERNQYLNGLFQHGPMDPAAKALEDWVASNFVTDHPTALQELIGRHGSTLNPSLWYRIATEITNMQTLPDDRDAVRQWVSILLNTAPGKTHEQLPEGLGAIAEISLREKLTDSLAFCFNQMCQMTLTIQSVTAPGNSQKNAEDEANPNLLEIQQIDRELFKPPRIELGTTCPQWMLEETWQKMKDRHLDEMARPVLEQAIQQLKVRHQTFCQSDTSTRAVGMDSRRRPEIWQAPPEYMSHGVNTIIDAARDCLEWLAEKDPETALRQCNQLIQEDSPLLQRLATHTISLVAYDRLDHDAKIDWIIDNGLTYRKLTKPEVFHSVRSIFPNASEGAQRRFLDALKQPPPEPQEES